MRLLLLLAAVLAVLPVSAQDASSVTWALTEADGLGVSEQTGAAVGSPVTSGVLVARDYNGTLQDGSGGPLGTFQRWYLDGAEWPVESGPDATRYVQFAVSAPAGGSLTLTDIDFVMNAGGTGEMDASVFIDTDAAFGSPSPLEVDIQISREAVGTFSYDISETLMDGETLYLRVYPWLGGGNPSSGRYLFLQNMVIAGDGSIPEPEPARGVNWSLTETDTTAVSSAADGLGGAPVRSSDVVVRDYTGVLRDADDAPGPLGPFQRWWRGDGIQWPVESAIDPTRYVEFAAGADAGETFYVDGVSLYVHGGSTSAMAASVFYATTPDFSDAVALEEDFPAGDGDFGGPTLREYPLDLAVAAGDSIYVRVYPYLSSGDPSVGRYLLLQDVTISGTTEAPLSVEGVLWTLSASDTTAVSATGPDLGGATVRASHLEVRDYDGDLRDAGDAVGPYGPFQRWWLGEGIQWQVETAIDPTRYVEFAAGPDPEFAFRVDSVSVYIHGDGTSEMAASVFYSLNADFSDAVALEEDFPAGDGDFGGPTLRTYPIQADVLEGDSIYVRVYPYLAGGNASATRYLLLQAMTVHGTAIDPAIVARDEAPAAGGVVLHPSAPNPTRSSATLRYALAEAGDVEIALFNTLGQRVAVLATGPRAAGTHDVTVRADGLAAGVYVVRLTAGGTSQTRTLTVVR